MQRLEWFMIERLTWPMLMRKEACRSEVHIDECDNIQIRYIVHERKYKVLVLDISYSSVLPVIVQQHTKEDEGRARECKSLCVGSDLLEHAVPSHAFIDNRAQSGNAGGGS